LISGNRSEDEGLFVRQHEYWAQTLIAALDREAAAQTTPKPVLEDAA
jgi:hypothetical protein